MMNASTISLAPLFGKKIVVQWLERDAPFQSKDLFLFFFNFPFLCPTSTNLWKRGCNPWATSLNKFPQPNVIPKQLH